MEWAIAAEPLDAPLVFSVQQVMHFNAFLWAVGTCLCWRFFLFIATLLPVPLIMQNILLPTHAISTK